MIFNYNLENYLYENFIESALVDYTTAIVLKCEFDENNICISDVRDIAIDEGNISTNSLQMKGNSRYIMITGTENAKHGPRMKISAVGGKVNRSGASNLISIYYDKGDVILDSKCNIKSIGMKNKEFNTYKDLYMRNLEIINLANDPTKAQYVDDALIHDELARRNGYNVSRNKNGDGIVTTYDGSIVKHINIKGDEI